MNKLFKIVLTILFTFPIIAMESGIQPFLKKSEINGPNYFDILPNEVIVLITHEVIKNSESIRDYGPFLLACKKFHRIGREELNHDWALEQLKKDIKCGINEKETNFFTAIRLKTMRWLKHAIAHNKDLVNQPCDFAETTPLIYAAKYRSIEALQLLLDNGAKINKGQMNSWTPLHVAANENSIEVVQILLKNNADITLKNRFGVTAYDFTTDRKIAFLIKMHSYKQYLLTNCSIL